MLWRVVPGAVAVEDGRGRMVGIPCMGAVLEKNLVHVFVIVNYSFREMAFDTKDNTLNHK